MPRLLILVALAILASGERALAEPLKFEVRLCPASKLYAYPLAPGTRFQSLDVPNVGVLNTGKGGVVVTDIVFDLMDKGEVIDSRRLAGETIRTAIKAGSAAQPQIDAFGFQFCDGKLLGSHPQLAASEALASGANALLTNQTFGWKGARDTLRVTAHATREGRTETAIAAIPIRSDSVKTPLHFPLQGRWAVVVAGTPHGGHRWALPEAFAYDIVAFGADDKTYSGLGQALTDYHAYGAPVLAAADGVVIEVVSDVPESAEILRRTGESFDAYGERMGEFQAKLLGQGEKAIAGNAIIVDHGDGVYSLYAHLKPGSIQAKVGDKVKAGDRIGQLGASGNATEPHLHFQVCDAPSSLHCAGIPLAFTNVELPYADGPRAIQAGDIVIAR